jgi:hypothetical protein
VGCDRITGAALKQSGEFVKALAEITKSGKVTFTAFQGMIFRP